MTDGTPKHPGQILLERVMTPLGVSRNKLARDIDVPVGRISDIVAGKRGVTPDTALRLAKYFGTTAELWLRLQGDYDLFVARSSGWAEAQGKVSVFQPAEGAQDAQPAPQPSARPVKKSPPPEEASSPAMPSADISLNNLSGDELPGDLPGMPEIDAETGEESDIDIPDPAAAAAIHPSADR